MNARTVPRRHAVPLAAVWLAAAAMLVAQQAAPAPPRQQTGALAPGGTGLIAGKVIDPGTGKPVPEAIVWLLIGGILRNESPRVMTDADGRFLFVNVPSGQYGLQAQRLGYMRGMHAQKLPLDEGRDIDVADGPLLTDVTLPIWKYAAIGGTVTDEAGEPVVGVTVQAFRKIVAFGEIRFTPAFRTTSATTDDRGVYRLSSLVPGEYAVSVPSTLTTFPADVMPDLLGQSDVGRQASAAIREIGVLGDSSNQQVGGSVLLTRRTSPIPPTPGEQDIGAVYRTTFHPAATRLGEATVFALGSGDDRSGLDITLKPVRAVRVSGRLLGPDGPVGLTAVRLIPSGDAHISFSPGFETATGLTDAAGRFTLLGVPEGLYFLWVETRRSQPAGQTAGGGALLWANEAITVGASDVVDLNVAVRRAPQVTGRIEVRGERIASNEAVLVNIEPVGAGGAAATVIPRDLRFSSELPPGRYLVTAFGSRASLCRAGVTDGGDVSDEPLNLTTDDVAVTVICGDTPTRLSGTVRTDRGTLDTDALVVVFPTERRFWTGAGLRPRRLASTKAGPSGTFSLANLPAGEYFVAAIPLEASEFWQDPKTLDALARSASRVSLAQGESRTIDLRTERIR